MNWNRCERKQLWPKLTGGTEENMRTSVQKAVVWSENEPGTA